jgi:hypothetical protein
LANSTLTLSEGLSPVLIHVKLAAGFQRRRW